jgi:hypothetical protein
VHSERFCLLELEILVSQCLHRSAVAFLAWLEGDHKWALWRV